MSGTEAAMKRIIIPVIFFICSSLFGWTRAVDTAEGERVGGCPSPLEVTNNPQAYSLPNGRECIVDKDCGYVNDKCCPDDSGKKKCVNPVPACRDGKRISPEDVLDGTCQELAGDMCMDRGCEDGPAGEGGWGAACCGGYAFEWISGVPWPTCGNGIEPAKDSEGQMFWCDANSVRDCPYYSECVTDPEGYEICCPTVCDPGELYTLPSDPCKTCACGPDGVPTDNCAVVDCQSPNCPADQTIRYLPDTCCGYECVPKVCELPIEAGPCEAASVEPYWSFNFESGYCEQFAEGGCQGNDNKFENEIACATTCHKSGCDDVACMMVSCTEDAEVVRTEIPGRCCPEVECVNVASSVWLKDGKLGYGGIIVVVIGAVIIIGSILALVFCYLHKKKHRSSTSPRPEYYQNNLTYDEIDEKKMATKEKNVYVVHDGHDVNDAKLMKEKEAMNAQKNHNGF